MRLPARIAQFWPLIVNEFVPEVRDRIEHQLVHAGDLLSCTSPHRIPNWDLFLNGAARWAQSFVVKEDARAAPRHYRAVYLQDAAGGCPRGYLLQHVHRPALAPFSRPALELAAAQAL
jgi:hypothetical protein